jgi:mono/diheme cytochrome c family protein
MSRPVLTVVFVLFVAALPFAQAARTVGAGVYSETQAARGGAVYAMQCAGCHGSALEGAQAPPLAGDAFISRWSREPLSELSNKIRHTMPADAQGTLTAQQSVDLVAHILKTGGFPPGQADLPADDAAVSQITWPAGVGPDTAASVSSAQAKAYPPLGNMAQLMRGIFFPNSNLIFTVQTRDPGAPAPPAAADTQAGFSFVDWGSGIYRGWELVDNAAIALADASPLMLAPGVRCENGRLAPVTDADWIRFTEEMIAVSRRVYRISQTRNQEAVSDATGDLSDACANCHRAYRDVRGAGRPPEPGDPSNKAARCMPR